MKKKTKENVKTLSFLYKLILFIIVILVYLFVNQILCVENNKIMEKGLVNKFNAKEEVSQNSITKEDISYTINSINSFKEGYTTIVHRTENKNTVFEITNNNFKDWIGYIVGFNEGSYYVIEKTEGLGIDKGNIIVPEYGFIVFFNRNFIEDIHIGDCVTLDFPLWETESGINEEGFGVMQTLVIGDVVANGSQIMKASSVSDNQMQAQAITDDLTLITEKSSPDTYTSTLDFMKINLYDYVFKTTTNNINTKWKNDKKYPGFQSASLGTTFSDSKWHYGFDGIITDLKAGQDGLTSAANGATGTINQTFGGANQPNSLNDSLVFTNLMKKTLGSDGYPALADGTSLGYLFGDESVTYVEKKNKKNLDGLFQYDKEMK